MNSHSPFLIGFVGGDQATIRSDFKLDRKPEGTGMLSGVKPKNPDLRMRIVIYGQGKAGKTSLAYHIKQGEFDGLIRNRIHCGVNAEVSGKRIWLVCSDEEGTLNTRDSKNELDVKTKYDYYAAFILIKLTKEQDKEKVKLFITNKTTEIRKNFPEAKIVLVASKSDKKFKTSGEILREIAQELGCLGAAIISAKNSNNVNLLVGTTLEHLIHKPALVATTTAPILRPLPTFTLTRSSSSLFSPAPAPTPAVSAPSSDVAADDRELIISKIEERLLELGKELASAVAADRDRKVHKLIGIKELLDLITFCPQIAIHQHVSSIRAKYGKELEEGRPSKTKILLDEINQIATQSRKTASL